MTTMNLAFEQLDSFRDNGFVVLRQLAEPDEVQQIRKIVMDLYDRKVGFKTGRQFDVLDPDSQVSTLEQLTNPRDFAPELMKTRLLSNALQLCKQILGPETILSAEFVLMKPARCGSATPWHQDTAYRSPSYSYEEVTLWMPLQDVDEQSGCMQFVPGTHTGPVLPHHSPHENTKAHSLECTMVPSPESVVAVPMKSGDCSIHTSRVLHGSPENHSEVTRFAYILVFRTPTTYVGEHHAYSWNLEKTNLNAQRYESWFWRGGFFTVFWRKLRRGDFSSMTGLKVSLQHALLMLTPNTAKRRREADSSRS